MAANAERLIELFHAAKTRPAGVERDAFLRDACEGDAGMEAQIRSLLAAHEEVGDFLQARPPDLAASLPTEKPGDRIGRYQLLEPIGEGGCGVVYLAEQTEPVRRRVALKVIKLGMDTKAVVARFEAERQALALMDHPNIARVLDAGTTDEGKGEGRRAKSEGRVSKSEGEGGKSEGRVSKSEGEGRNEGRSSKFEAPSPRSDGRRPVGEPPPSDLGLGTLAPGPRTSPFGLRPSNFGLPPSSFPLPLASARPYFVMELVRGIRITEYCDQNGLSTRERLELFIQVCQAVQHAHQKGIIHRDLKPSNILVTSHDGVPVPKVIDFGIAKAVTNQRLTDQTVFTAFEQFLGTPAYMSPEQAEMSGLDVDTRSDIYSLGVLLYELLTGVTPLDARELKRVGLDEMRRLIREKDPVPPSTRLTQEWARRGWGSAPAAAAVPDAEAQGGSRLREQIKLLRGDLDWIVMKCLEKDRTRRYEAANGLAADLQRHLNDEPVVARPPSAAYRFQKAWRRHKVAFTAAGAVAGSLLLGMAVSLWLAVRASRAQREALVAGTKAVAAEASERTQRYTAEQEKIKAQSAQATAERQLYAANMHVARLAFEKNDFARLRQILKETADDPNRGFEWYYWQRQAHLELKTLRGHLAPVVAVAISPDGQRVVTGSYDHTARVWDAEQGAELIALRGHDREVKAVAFSPDGRRIVTGSADQTVRLWDAVTGQGGPTLEGHEHWVTSVACSPDGRRIVSGSLDGTARLWEADSGRWLHTLPHGERVWSVAFSGDGQWVLTGGGDETARVWNVNTGEAMSPRIEAPTARMESRGDGRGFTPFTAVFPPDSRLIITGSRDQAVGVWERVSGRELFRLEGKPHWLSPLHTDVPLAVAVSRDGERLVTGRLDRTADVWALAGRTNLFTLRGHEAEIAAVAISPDGRRIVTGSFDHTAKIWDATRSREALLLPGHTKVVPAMAYSPDGQFLATGSWDGTARVWQPATGRLLRLLPHGTNRLWAVGFSPDGRRLVTGGDDGEPVVWAWATGAQVLALRGATASVTSAAFFPDGRRILTGHDDRIARIWDALTGRALFALHETEAVVHAAVSPDGERIVTVSESTFVGGDGVRRLHPGVDGIISTLFRGAAQVWDAAGGRRLFPLAGQLGGISTVAFSPDSRRIVAGGMGRTVSVWDAATGREELRLEGHSDRVIFTTFVPDGTRIVTGGFDDATTRVWDATSKQELLTLTGRLALALSPDGRQLATGGDPPAGLIEIATAEQVAAWNHEEQAARERIEAERQHRREAAQRLRDAVAGP
ncbi:MAG: protein kinase [Verrucomicrobiales bacterium]|nr:protein kinase [Verrucomicrobiales bacterium]